MTMDAVNKTALEKRMVMGLLVFFVLILGNTMKTTGMFRAKKPKAAAVSQVTVVKPLAQALGEHWKQVESLEEPARSTLRPAEGLVGPPAYTAHTLREPLRSLLPEPTAEPPVEAKPAPGAQRPAEDALPSLTIQGLWLDGSESRAIINGEVYGLGDRLHGATITSIARKGVTVEFGGRAVELTVAAPSVAGGAGSRPRRGR